MLLKMFLRKKTFLEVHYPTLSHIQDNALIFNFETILSLISIWLDTYFYCTQQNTTPQPFEELILSPQIQCQHDLLFTVQFKIFGPQQSMDLLYVYTLQVTVSGKCTATIILHAPCTSMLIIKKGLQWKPFTEVCCYSTGKQLYNNSHDTHLWY